MDTLCIYISSEDSSRHISICSECNESMELSATSDDFVLIDSYLVDGILISCEDDTLHIAISAEFTLGMTIYSSYVCYIDRSGYLVIENITKDTDPPSPITIFISDNFYNEIKVESNLDWTIK